MRSQFARDILILALTGMSLPAQTSQEVYERFRGWFSQQPVQVQRGPESDLEARYRAHLKQQGLAPGAIDAEIRVINEQGKRLEVERWNRILTAEEPRFNTSPNAFMAEMVKDRKPGKALDVGMGQGRNALWLAQRGWEVTGFDPAERAVALARANAVKLGVKLATEINGYEEFDFGESRWDLILLSYVGGREMNALVTKSLRPGGIVILEAFHRDAAKSTPIGAAVVFDTAEVPSLFHDLRVVRYEEPLAVTDFGQMRARVVRYCAEKPIE
jgi:2-polyprenyl-3-methyl-5-hydroxy-6-metoxy-1,4-benzoquinol methylase